MKSALPKVLHPLLGRTLSGTSCTPPPPRPPSAPSWWWGTAPTRSAPTSPRSPPAPCRCCRPSSSAPATPCGSRSTRSPTRPGPSWCSTATCRCCARRPSPTWSHATRSPPRPPPCSPPRSPTRPGWGGSCATPTGRLEQIVEERDADARQRAIREINAGIYAFDAGAAARGAGQALHRQRPGRGVPDRRLRAAPGGRRPGRRARRRRRRRDAGLQRPGGAGRAAPAAARPDQRGLDAGRRHPARPADHLDRRHRDAWSATP